MKVQYNKHTNMFWAYIPVAIAKKMDLKKGEEVSFNIDENNLQECIIKKENVH